jgi:hypothetical protein
MTTVNGVAYDFTCVSSAAYNLDISLGLESISYGHTMEIETIQGTAAEPYATTPGSLKAENAEIEMQDYMANAFRKKLGAGYMRKVIPLTVSYKNEGAPLVTDSLIDCRIIGEKKNPKKGATPCTTTFTLHVLKLRLDGVSPV